MNSTMTLPSTYSEWRKIIVNLGRQQEQYALEKKMWTSPSSSHHVPPHPTIPSHPSNPPEKKTSTGTTFGGTGKPMEIDKTTHCCFGCGKTGHFCKDCPDAPTKKLNMRALAHDLVDEELEELREYLNSLDFTDGR
jgi:hypothetical protein